MKKTILSRAFADTLPVMTGYLFLGFGFGILMYRSGFGLFWSGAMSLFIYAGSMQYMAVGLLSAGADLMTAAVTTFVVNARHLFYGISMVDRYRGTGGKKPYLIFALTDETYSLVSREQAAGQDGYPLYCLLVSALDHLYWVGGTVLGALAGAWIPIDYKGIEFVLTALFVSIFVEQWLSTKDHLPALTGLVVTGVCLLVFGSNYFLIPSMILIAVALIMTPRGGKETENA